MSMRHEQQILLACLSLNSTPTGLSDLARTSPDEWRAVVALSIQNGVAPLLYQRLLQKHLLRSLPEEIQAHLYDVYLKSVLLSTHRDQALSQVLQTLRQSGVAVIPLKGAYLAEKVYENTALRSMFDLDLLVSRQDLQLSARALQGIGYVSSWVVDLQVESEVMHHIPPLTHPVKPVVELHWTLAPPTHPFTIPIDEIWQQAQPGLVAGVEVFLMDRLDLLLHLCLHVAYQEYFSIGLRPFCDIAMLVESSAIDWTELGRRAQKWKAERSVFLAILVTSRLLGTPLPADFQSHFELQDYTPVMLNWAVEQVLNQLAFSERLAEVWTPSPWPTRLKILFSRIFPRPEIMRYLYPHLAARNRLPLAYLLRLKDIPYRFGSQAWKLLRKDPAALAAAEQQHHRKLLLDWQKHSYG